MTIKLTKEDVRAIAESRYYMSYPCIVFGIFAVISLIASVLLFAFGAEHSDVLLGVGLACLINFIIFFLTGWIIDEIDKKHAINKFIKYWRKTGNFPKY